MQLEQCWCCRRLCGLAVAFWITYHYHPCVRMSAWGYPKSVTSLTSIHYIWRSLGPFSLPCVQKYPTKHQSSSSDKQWLIYITGSCLNAKILSFCFLDEKTMNLVLSLFNFRMLLFTELTMSSLQASIKDEILNHLSLVFKVMKSCV